MGEVATAGSFPRSHLRFPGPVKNILFSTIPCPLWAQLLKSEIPGSKDQAVNPSLLICWGPRGPRAEDKIMGL